MTQILHLVHAPQLCRHSFVPSPSNALAWQWIETWPAWKTLGVWIQGPRHSGKTHMAHIFSEKSGALYIEAPGLTSSMVESLLKTPQPVVLDAFGAGSKDQEELLFHLYNILKGASKSLVIFSQWMPQDIIWNLKDTETRIKTLSTATILPPDDTLMQAIIAKRFSDLQTDIDPKALIYLASNIHRSYDSIDRWVNHLHQEALHQKRAITIPFMKKFLFSS